MLNNLDNSGRIEKHRSLSVLRGASRDWGKVAADPGGTVSWGRKS
jgi:hypothetical protein